MPHSYKGELTRLAWPAAMVPPICASWKVCLLVVLNVFSFPFFSDAQGQGETTAVELIAYPTRASIAPIIDGVVLNDPA
ncbi:uncharacterized protein METZ01_LOCUS146833, partial [marine metagenome]